MKTYLVTVSVEERYYIEASSEDEALDKMLEREPKDVDIMDTSVEEWDA